MNRVMLISAMLVCVSINAPGQTSHQISNPRTTAAIPSPPQNPTACSPDKFPASKGGSTQCCQEGNDVYLVVTNSPKGIVLGHRQLGPACTTETGTKNCFVRPTSNQGDPGTCHFGACGAYVAETWTGIESHVFYPKPVLKRCGFEAIALVNGVKTIVADFPHNETFTNQQPYPPVAAGCPYNSCLYGGIAATSFAITVVEDHAMGQTFFDPWHFTSVGAANFTLALATPGDVTITGTPTGANAALTEVVFSGACESHGHTGQQATCVIHPPFPKTAITISYRPSIVTNPVSSHP